MENRNSNTITEQSQHYGVLYEDEPTMFVAQPEEDVSGQNFIENMAKSLTGSEESI